MLVCATVFMVLLLSMAPKSNDPPWGNPLFWAAALFIVASFVVMPQIFWRDKSPVGRAKKDTSAWLLTVAPASMGVGFGLLLWGVGAWRTLW